MICGKGGLYGTKSKRRIIPVSEGIQGLVEGHFGLYETIVMTPRTIQRLIKKAANRARITRPVTPRVLRHTFSVTAIRKGISLPSLQRLFGHN